MSFNFSIDPLLGVGVDLDFILYYLNLAPSIVARRRKPCV
jgi:hypothetical protein